jgi:hypothetical protein
MKGGRVPTRLTCVVLLGISLVSTSAPAQTISSPLSTLLTQQQPTSILVPDVPAAEATRDTVSRLFSIELSNLPVASSSGGFVYRLNPSLGVVERASEGFGPFFTERVLRNGRGQGSIGLSYQFANFSTLQGADLDAGTFPTNAARTAGSGVPFSVDTLSLKLDSQTTTVFTSYGVTDRLAIGGSVPFVKVHFSGTRLRNEDGRSTLQSSQSGSAAGVGDITMNARYLLVGAGLRGVSVGTDLRVPSGRSEDLLGSGKTLARFIGIGSYEEGHLSVNANAGYAVGGASRETSWRMAATFAASSRVTVVGEVLGQKLSELSYVQDVYQPHPLMPGVETMRWLTAQRGIVTTLLVAGAKWNVARSWLLNTNMLIRVTDSGLRARVTPAVSLDYDFDR